MSILQLRRYQKKDADLDAVAASGVAAAWTAYTPTVTAGSGTFTTVSATGRYLTIGKTTIVQIMVVITTNGTAAAYVLATLPNTAATLCGLVGRESNVTGKMIMGLVGAITSTSVAILQYDGSYPGGSGYNLFVSGCYENA